MKRRVETVTIEEAAEALGVSRGGAYRAAHAGELPVIKIGKRLLIPRNRFEEMIEGRPPEPKRNEPQRNEKRRHV
jgi:excisionase family DNA binding protein